MPLPDGGNIAWPPEHCQDINRQYAAWAAWWTGDPEQLAAIYGGGATGDSTGFFASESGGFKGAVNRAVGAVRRWFWSSPTSNTQQRSRLHVPLAGDIAAASADLLFSEPPALTIPTEPVEPVEGEEPVEPPEDPTQSRLTELITDGTWATLLEAAEVCSALGGVYLRVVWDLAVRSDGPWIDAVHPDVAIPEWRRGKLQAVTFWRELKRAGKLVVRHLERHELQRDANGTNPRAVILHAVYQGDADTLGQPMPLADYPETAALAKAVNAEQAIVTTSPTLTAVYVPNMRPNRIWRTTPHAAHLGRSDYAGVEPLMDALDMVWSSWMRDVDLGKARLIVPREYLQNLGPGRGAAVDLDREVYEGINAMTDEEQGPQIKEVQFAIRVAEHQATVDSLKTQIVGSAGYSAGTFGLDDGTAATATEINQRLKRTYTTRDKKTRYWAPALADILEALLYVDAEMFRTAIAPARPAVEFPAAVSEDPLAQAQTLQALALAEAVSVETKVRMLHPDWTDPQVAEEVARIDQDKGAGLPGNSDPFEAGNAFAAAPLPGLPIAEPGAAPGAEPQE